MLKLRATPKRCRNGIEVSRFSDADSLKPASVSAARRYGVRCQTARSELLASRSNISGRCAAVSVRGDTFCSRCCRRPILAQSPAGRLAAMNMPSLTTSAALRRTNCAEHRVPTGSSTTDTKSWLRCNWSRRAKGARLCSGRQLSMRRGASAANSRTAHGQGLRNGSGCAAPSCFHVFRNEVSRLEMRAGVNR